MRAALAQILGTGECTAEFTSPTPHGSPPGLAPTGRWSSWPESALKRSVVTSSSKHSAVSTLLSWRYSLCGARCLSEHGRTAFCVALGRCADAHPWLVRQLAQQHVGADHSASAVPVSWTRRCCGDQQAAHLQLLVDIAHVQQRVRSKATTPAPLSLPSVAWRSSASLTPPRNNPVPTVSAALAASSPNWSGRSLFNESPNAAAMAQNTSAASSRAANNPFPRRALRWSSPLDMTCELRSSGCVPSTSSVIETERLILRRWRDADRAPFAAMKNADPEVVRWFLALLSSRATRCRSCRRVGSGATAFGFWAPSCARRRVPRIQWHHAGVVDVVHAGDRDRLAPGSQRLGHGYATEAGRARRWEIEPDVVSFMSAGNVRSARGDGKRIGPASAVSGVRHRRCRRVYSAASFVSYR